MQTTIKKWGNIPTLRTSSSIMTLAELSVDPAVNKNVLKGRLIIEPIAPNQTCLEGLLARIRLDNIHTEENFGLPVDVQML